eukprot:TRINITY_DN57156_c0_g1_i1.p1 TRINITY_DN57156_c0_g1~~TRINITY_DN57156_c0_g1_i1.p1  ORF type:complete len:485 (+),score=63.10 TRINITY_DN57156_c0_g1_i1:19-1473(+)
MESCDTLVVLPHLATRGVTIFGKNSDRPPEECQPLVQRPRATHPSGSVLDCQFVQGVPQVQETHAHIGSMPHWCWGYEHGVNEHGVCIGNEAVFSKYTVSETPRLVGMELVRLGLERGRTASEAVGVITQLITEFGQGAFKNDAGVKTYDNGFLVADTKEAFVIETAGFHWAVKQVEGAVPISNCHSIRTDWEQLSLGCEEAAIQNGWWDHSCGRLDFKTAFENPTPVPFEGYVPTGERRLRRQHELLELIVGQGYHKDSVEGHAKASVGDIIAHLCDHGQAGDGISSLGWPESATICRHSCTSQTTASMVVEIGSSVDCTCWCSLYNPCLSVYFPIFPAGRLPAELSRGGALCTDDSAWWMFHNLHQLVVSASTKEERLACTQIVREHWAPVQRQLMDAVSVLRERKSSVESPGEAASEEDLTRCMRTSFDTVLGALADIKQVLEARVAIPKPQFAEPEARGVKRRTVGEFKTEAKESRTSKT